MLFPFLMPLMILCSEGNATNIPFAFGINASRN
jgi:hypothetical protein